MQEAEVNHEIVRRPMPCMKIVRGLRKKLYTTQAPPVGAAAGCDLLTLSFHQDQKIAASFHRQLKELVSRAWIG